MLKFVKSSLLAVLLLTGLQGVSQAASCDAVVTGRSADPDDLRGVRTKWKSLSRDKRNTIQPDLAGLGVETWVNGLEKLGVNLVELNLEPQRLLASAPTISSEAWTQYIDDVVNAADGGSLSSGSAKIEDQMIPGRQYTAAQRNAVLLGFLQKLETLRKQGNIKGQFSFVVHQRLWFNGEGRKGERRRRKGTKEFVGDMASLINDAKSRCLDHWLAGIRLGEHAVTDMSVLLPLTERLAEGVNAKTGGWLKQKLFLVNGGGWGAEYTSFSLDFGNFFKAISKDTGTFALGYKFMQFNGKKGAGYIKQRMERAACGDRSCDVASSKDWQTYLGTLGLKDLKRVINEYKTDYPMHANVMFVGDSSDALATIFNSGNSPEIAALKSEMPDGPGWSGKLFMSGYLDAEGLKSRRVGEKGKDIGWTLYFVDGGKPVLQPKSYDVWKNW